MNLILYTLLIFAPLHILSIIVVAAGSLALLAMVSTAAHSYRTKIDDAESKKGIRSLIIGQYIVIIFNTITFIFIATLYSNFWLSIPSILLKILYIIFEIAHFARYLFIGYSFYMIAKIHKKMAINYAYNQRRLYAGYFSLPVIILKFVFFNSDALIFNTYVMKGLLAVNDVFNQIVLVHIIIHIVLGTVYLAYAIESTIKFRLVTQKMTSES